MNRSRPAGLLHNIITVSSDEQCVHDEHSQVRRGHSFNVHTAAALSKRFHRGILKWSLDQKFGLHVTILRDENEPARQ